jgi:hypothetical protein
MTLPSKRQLSRETFVLRLWAEETVSSVWRGEVQNVRSGQTAVIRDLEELLDYLRSQLDEQAAALAKERGGLR